MATVYTTNGPHHGRSSTLTLADEPGRPGPRRSFYSVSSAGSNYSMDETFVESASQRASDEASKYEYEMTRPQKSDASSPSPGPDEVDLVDRTPKTQPPMSLIREIAFIFICCSGQLVTQAGLGQAIPIGHIIGRSFGNPSPGELSWFAAAYSLTVGTFILIAGRVGDMIGHKTLFVYGWAWYSFWSLVAGVSVWTHSQIFFDVCRAMQGIGPAVLLPCSLALLGRSYAPGRRKEMVFALYGATAPNGFILGAVFSSIFAEWAWWPWSYWAMAVACLALGTMAYFVIPAPEDDEDDADHGPQTFDYAGAVTGIAGLVLFNVAWNQAPIVGWEKPYIIVVLVLGVLFFGIFVMVEKRVKQPLVPLDGLGGETGIVLGCIAFGWSSFGIWLFYGFQFLGELRGGSPLLITAQFSPSCVSGLAAALTTGFLLSRIPPGFIMMISMMAFCIGNILFATMPVGQTYWIQAFLSSVVTPWGMDMSFPCATILLSNLVPKRNQGIAASLVATVVNYSISIGLGIGGTVETHVNDGGKDLLRGYRGAWYSGIGLAACGVLMSFYFIYHNITEKAKAVKAKIHEQQEKRRSKRASQLHA